ncbi:MAG: SurA N-terminal domain-containing protein [Armatimonadota bacterium]
MRQGALLALIAIALVAAVGCGRKQQQGGEIALVNNRPITKAQLYEALEKADNGDAGRRMLDSLIVRDLVREEAKKRNIEVGKQELDRRMAALADYLLAMTGKDFATYLSDNGLTEEDMRASVSSQMLLAKLVFTDTERQKYFEENKTQLADMPHNNESVIYRQVVVGSQSEAEAVRKELLAEAKEGKVSDEAFAKVAEQRTLDPNGRRRGGMAGWVVKGKTGDAELEKVLFALKPGEVSEPIPVAPPAPPKGQKPPAAPTQPQFYRVAMVDKHITPGALTLANNEDIVEETMLKDPRYQAQLSEFFNNLRARASIKVIDPRYRALEEAYKQGREAREQRLSQPGAMMPQPTPGQPGRQPQMPPGRTNRPAPPRGR